MADLEAWQKSAKARLERYQKDRGSTTHETYRAPRLRGGVHYERGAGKELAPIANRVPPL